MHTLFKRNVPEHRVQKVEVPLQDAQLPSHGKQLFEERYLLVAQLKQSVAVPPLQVIQLVLHVLHVLVAESA